MTMKKQKPETINEAVLKQFKTNLRLAIDQYEPAPGQEKVPTLTHGRQTWLARLVGDVSPKAAAKWFNGRSMPGRGRQAQVAAVLGVRMEWLFFNLGPMREGHQVEYLILAIEQAVESVCAAMDKKTRAKLSAALFARLQHLP